MITLAPVAVAPAPAPAPAGREVAYGPVGAWVAPPPAPTTRPDPPGAPLRFVYFDQQARLGRDGDEVYSAYRLKLLDAAALGAGAITLSWNPSVERVTVHGLAIIRDGRRIDVLAGTRFDIIQRENNLERSMLDGELTATLQAPGLQVGDELEFAATVRRSDPFFSGHSFGGFQLPAVGAPGAFRARVTWAHGRDIHWKAWPDLPRLQPVSTGGRDELAYELRDPATAVTPDGAPPRFKLRRMIQYSSFASWAELSHLLWPLFDRAATTPPGSAVKAEAARIAAASADPAVRAAAAMRLVQERVRYVYVGLNGGNYRPASADDTWTRRFGDCKAKTVLLLALLRELGVPAEPVLVGSTGGDGTDEALPTPAVFDHVVLRARVGATTYWLDGARPGDHTLAAVPAPTFRWGLPLRPGAVDLEAIPVVALASPRRVEVTEIDARSGFGTAKVATEEVTRGDEAWASRNQLADLAPEDAARLLKAYWRQQVSWVEPEAVAWRFDDSQNALVLTMQGAGKPEWEGDASAGRTLSIPHAGFYPPTERRRPSEQAQDAPWMTDFPHYRCSITTIRLPPADSGFRWSYSSKPMDRYLGGTAYWRQSSLRDGVMRTLMSTRTLIPEISANEAAATDLAIPGFDNAFSQVSETRAETASPPGAPGPAPPDAASVDWASPSAPCAAPR